MIHSYMTGFIDFPGSYALTVFFSGCNLKCPFCYNRDVVGGSGYGVPMLDVEGKIVNLDRALCKSAPVVLSGGEPTIAEEFDAFVDRHRGLRPLGLHTNGLVIADDPEAFDSVILSLKPRNCGTPEDYVRRITDAMEAYEDASYREVRIVREDSTQAEIKRLIKRIPADWNRWAVKWVEKEPAMQWSLNYEN